MATINVHQAKDGSKTYRVRVLLNAPMSFVKAILVLKMSIHALKPHRNGGR
jgi:hypothetical protein